MSNPHETEQFWENHYSVRWPPPGCNRQPKWGKKLPIEVKERTEEDYRQMLLTPRTPTQRFMLRIPGLPIVTVRMESVGQTAFIGHWLRGFPIPSGMEAMTICLGGISEADDEIALSIIEKRSLNGKTDSEFTTYVKALVDQVRGHQRPLGGHIHFDEESYDSTALRVCSTALAVAFFDLFGADEPSPSSNEARSR